MIRLDSKGRYFIDAQDDGKIAFRGDTLYIFEWAKYRIVAKNVNGNVEINVGDETLEDTVKVDNNSFIIFFQIKNYVGKTRIRILEDGREVKLRFKQFEVLSDKIPKIFGREASDIEEIIGLNDEFCRNLIEEISKRCLSLPFSIRSPAGFEFVEADDQIDEFFAYHFLRSNRGRIISAYEFILKNPHKVLVDELEWSEFWDATDVDEDTLLGMVYHPEHLIEVSDSAVAEIDGKGYAPLKVLQRSRYESFDTLENRFVKHFLAEVTLWCERIMECFKERLDERAKVELENLHSTLEFFRNDPLFADVGELTIFPYTSQVLLKREGYRDLLELWKEFRAYSPFFGDLDRAIANKDVAKLYEYWCFFRLVEDLRGFFGECKLHVNVERTGELSEGLVYAKFGNGWKLYYNREKRGYSIKLRPDFSLFDENGLIGVFDAKFKLDIANVGGSERTWAKLEDIYKMHTYRDALRTKFAIVLYPGDKSTFFEVNGNKIENFKLDYLFNGKIEGIGYLSYRPKLGWAYER